MSKVLQGVLDRLGTRTSQVARRLRVRDIRGERGSDTACPLANYLKGQGYHPVSVCETRIVAIDKRGTRHRLATPPRLEAFVADFDLGLTPELEWEESDP